MKKMITLLPFALLLMLTSCLSVKEIRYLQPNQQLNLNEDGLISYDNIPEYRIMRNDILKLNIITTPKGDAAQFYSALNTIQNNAPGAGNANNNNSNNNFYFNGLKLDENGEVYVFGIGNVKALGRTTAEIAAEIQKKVNENFMPGKSEVRVLLEGIKYTLLYDLEGRSLRRTAQEANINILEVIAENGGLDRTIDRKNVVVYRKFPEGIKKAQIDLTREDLQNSPYFWVQNGDLIMFNTKPKNVYGFGREPIQTLTTGVTLLTTALSIYLLFTKL